MPKLNRFQQIITDLKGLYLNGVSWLVKHLDKKYIHGGRMICPFTPTKNQHFKAVYCNLNKLLPATSCLNQKKSTHQELTELNTILLEKLLSTESCPQCLMCFAPPGTLREPGTNHQKETPLDLLIHPFMGLSAFNFQFEIFSV